MCEAKIDWTKEVQFRYTGHTEWRRFTVFSFNPDYPKIVYGIVNGESMPSQYHVFAWNFRNTPPPPPEVWIVWRRCRDGWRFHYLTHGEEGATNFTDDCYPQKVTCDAPDLR